LEVAIKEECFFFLPFSQEHQLNMVLGNFSKLQENAGFALTLTLKKPVNFASSVEG